MLTTTRNIFDQSTPYHTDIRDSYNTPKTLEIQQQLCNFFGNPKYNQLSKIMANDIGTFKSPAAATMVDVYHQSNQTWTEFIESTSLSHLQRNNIEIFTPFQHFQSEFTSKVHAPLSQLLASKSALFKDDANDIALTLSQIYNALKFKKIAENTCLQIDARVNVDLCDSINSTIPIYNCDDSGNDSDGDDLYDEMTRQFNFVSKNITGKRNNFDDEKSSNNKDNEELSHINQVIRNMLAELPTEAYSYKRYEMSLDLNEKHLTTSAKKNKVPRFSFLNSPLCRVVNSIKAIDVTQNNTLTFSFHAMTDCIRMYCYVVSDGKIYGSRIFEKDLLSYGIIGSLFEDKIIDGHTTAEVQKNMETKKHDDIYKEYKLVLFKRNAKDLAIQMKNEQIKYEITPKVEEKSECDYGSDNQSIATVEILHNALHYQNYQTQQNQRLQNTICTLRRIISQKDVIIEHQYKEICRLKTNTMNSIQNGNQIKNHTEMYTLKHNMRSQISIDSTITTITTDSRSDTESTQALQSDWYSDDLQNELENIQMSSQRRWNFQMNMSRVNVNEMNEYKHNQCVFFKQKSDLTDENLIKLNEETKTCQQNNEVDMQSMDSNDTSVQSDGQQINDDIFDDHDHNQNVAMPNPYNSNINNNDNNILLPSLLYNNNQALIPHQYDKLDTNISNIGNVYLHNNILPGMMERLEDLSQRLDELLQTPQNQQIVMNIYQNAWNAYFVVCICLITNHAINNSYFYICYLTKLYQFLMKKWL